MKKKKARESLAFILSKMYMNVELPMY